MYSHSGLLYAIGGFDGVSPLRSAEVYDPHTDRWSSLPDMSSNRFGLGACHCDGKVILQYTMEIYELAPHTPPSFPMQEWSSLIIIIFLNFNYFFTSVCR